VLAEVRSEINLCVFLSAIGGTTKGRLPRMRLDDTVEKGLGTAVHECMNA
jgi:hypothetical protein